MEALQIAKSKIDRLSDDPIVRASQLAETCSRLDKLMAEMIDVRYWLAHARKALRTIYTEKISLKGFDPVAVSEELEALYRRLNTLFKSVGPVHQDCGCQAYELDNYKQYEIVRVELEQEVQSFDLGKTTEDVFNGHVFDEAFLNSVSTSQTNID